MFILKERHQPGVYVPLRALFLVSNAFVNTGCAYVIYLCSLCECIHIKFTETRNILEILPLASL